MDLGTLSQLPNGYRVRFERRLSHPPAVVWRALTDPDALRAWFPATVEGDWVVGSRLRFSFDDDRGGEEAEAAQDPDHPDHWGEVLEVDEPRRLAFRWSSDVLAFDLRPDGGGTVLVLTTTVPERDHVCRDSAGWHVCLDALVAAVHGEDAPDPDRWLQVHAAYEEAFGPDPVPHVHATP